MPAGVLAQVGGATAQHLQNALYPPPAPIRSPPTDIKPLKIKNIIPLKAKKKMIIRNMSH